MTDPTRSGGNGPRDDREPAGAGPRRWVVAIGILVASAVLALMVFLHLSGAIGPGSH